MHTPRIVARLVRSYREKLAGRVGRVRAQAGRLIADAAPGTEVGRADRVDAWPDQHQLDRRDRARALREAKRIGGEHLRWTDRLLTASLGREAVGRRHAAIGRDGRDEEASAERAVVDGLGELEQGSRTVTRRFDHEIDACGIADVKPGRVHTAGDLGKDARHEHPQQCADEQGEAGNPEHRELVGTENAPADHQAE